MRPLEDWIVGGLTALGLLSFAFLRWQARTRPENAPKHPTRRNLLRRLLGRPGSNIRDLARSLDINPETTRYHLRILERSGIIHGAVVGRDHRFFPPGQPDEVREAVGTLRRGWSIELAQRVLERPGIRQKELTTELGITRKILRVYVDELSARGLIEERRDGHARRYHPTAKLDGLRGHVPELARP